MRRALPLIAALAVVGCGSAAGTSTALQTPDPTLPAYCQPEPNAPPRCTQGSSIPVGPVSPGDPCHAALNPPGEKDGAWDTVPDSGGELVCGAGQPGAACEISSGGTVNGGNWSNGICLTPDLPGTICAESLTRVGVWRVWAQGQTLCLDRGNS